MTSRGLVELCGRVGEGGLECIGVTGRVTMGPLRAAIFGLS